MSSKNFLDWRAARSSWFEASAPAQVSRASVWAQLAVFLLWTGQGSQGTLCEAISRAKNHLLALNHMLITQMMDGAGWSVQDEATVISKSTRPQ